MFGNTIVGKEGAIRIDEIGATIGIFETWKLAREKHPQNDEKYLETYRFNGSLKYINPALFNDEDYSPAVIITVSRDRRAGTVKQYRLEPQEGGTTTLKGRSLLMTGVKLWPLGD